MENAAKTFSTIQKAVANHFPVILGDTAVVGAIEFLVLKPDPFKALKGIKALNAAGVNATGYRATSTFGGKSLLGDNGNLYVVSVKF